MFIVKTDAEVKKLEENELDQYLTALLDHIMTKRGTERTKLMALYNKQSDINFLDADSIDEPTDEDYDDARDSNHICMDCNDKDTCDSYTFQNCSKLRNRRF